MRADPAWIPPDLPEQVIQLPFVRVWQPLDLTAVLSGTWSPPEPAVGRRDDGVGLFYPGKVHTVSSESEAGKTWLALSAVVDELTAGENVIYVDFENDEGGIVGRLLALQVPSNTIRDRFHYLRPSEPLGTGIHLDDLRALILDTRATLTVVDGVTESMTLHGLNMLDNRDVATFGRILPRRVAELGPAVVCLDHVVKAADNRGRYALGGVHKLNGLDGAALILENRSPFGIGLKGRSTVKIAKDRPGQLRKHGLPSSGGMYWFGDLMLESHAEAFAEVMLVAPERTTSSSFRPSHVMAKIVAALTEHSEMSGRQIQAVVGGRAATVRDALSLLQVEGYVSNKSPHALLKPYVVEVEK